MCLHLLPLLASFYPTRHPLALLLLLTPRLLTPHLLPASAARRLLLLGLQVPAGTPVINALSKQRAMLENIFRACVGLPPENNMMLEFKC